MALRWSSLHLHRSLLLWERELSSTRSPFVGSSGVRRTSHRSTVFAAAADWGQSALRASDWTLPHKIARDYLKQVTTEKRPSLPLNSQPSTISRIGHQVRQDNPLWDCELMILVAAVIPKVVQAQTQVG